MSEGKIQERKVIKISYCKERFHKDDCRKRLRREINFDKTYEFVKGYVFTKKINNDQPRINFNVWEILFEDHK